MIQTIRSKDRYHLESDWLDTYWHFSFDSYHDPANMNFGPLRVFNDDTFGPAGGFPLHSHREMEIVTYLIDGALEHRDDLGNTGVIRPGEIQRMSAGTGVRHSEYNHSKKEPVHLVQLWITPAVHRLQPSWEQKSFSLADRSGKLLRSPCLRARTGTASRAPCKFIRTRRSNTPLLAPGHPPRTRWATRDALTFLIGRKLGRFAGLLGRQDIIGHSAARPPERLGMARGSR